MFLNHIYGCIVAVTLPEICHLGPDRIKLNMGTIMFQMYSIVDNINLSFISFLRVFLRIFAHYSGSH